MTQQEERNTPNEATEEKLNEASAQVGELLDAAGTPFNGEKSELSPEGSELYDAHLKSGTAFVTEEGEPCTNAEIDESLKGKPTKDDVIALLSPKDRKRAMRKKAREEFVGLVGQAIVHIGLSESMAGKVIAAIGYTGAVDTNFAFNPDTNAGIIWGYTNGGAMNIPIPLENIDMATVVSIENASTFKMSGGAGKLQSRTPGYWLAAYRVPPVETPSTTDLAPEPGDIRVSVPERGMTNVLQTYDENGTIPATDAELELGAKFTADLNTALQTAPSEKG